MASQESSPGSHPATAADGTAQPTTAAPAGGTSPALSPAAPADAVSDPTSATPSASASSASAETGAPADAVDSSAAPRRKRRLRAIADDDEDEDGEARPKRAPDATGPSSVSTSTSAVRALADDSDDDLTLEERHAAAARAAEERKRALLRAQMFDADYDEERDILSFSSPAGAGSGAAASGAAARRGGSFIADDDDDDARVTTSLVDKLGAGSVLSAAAAAGSSGRRHALDDDDDDDEEDDDDLAYGDDGSDYGSRKKGRRGVADDDGEDDEFGVRVTGGSTFGAMAAHQQQRLAAMFGEDVKGLFARPEELHSLAAASALAEGDAAAAAAASAVVDFAPAPAVLTGAARVRAERSTAVAAAVNRRIATDIPERMQARASIREKAAALLGVDVRSFVLGAAFAPGVLDAMTPIPDLAQAIPRPAPLLVRRPPAAPAPLPVGADADPVQGSTYAAAAEAALAAAAASLATSAPSAGPAGEGDSGSLAALAVDAAVPAGAFVSSLLQRAIEIDPEGQATAAAMDSIVRDLSVESEARWLTEAVLSPTPGSAGAVLGVGVSASAEGGPAPGPSRLISSVVAVFLGFLHREHLDVGYIAAYKKDQLSFPCCPTMSLSETDMWALDEADERYHSLLLSRAALLMSMNANRISADNPPLPAPAASLSGLPIDPHFVPYPKSFPTLAGVSGLKRPLVPLTGHGYTASEWNELCTAARHARARGSPLPGDFTFGHDAQLLSLIIRARTEAALNDVNRYINGLERRRMARLVAFHGHDALVEILGTSPTASVAGGAESDASRAGLAVALARGTGVSGARAALKKGGKTERLPGFGPKAAAAKKEEEEQAKGEDAAEVAEAGSADAPAPAATAPAADEESAAAADAAPVVKTEPVSSTSADAAAEDAPTVVKSEHPSASPAAAAAGDDDDLVVEGVSAAPSAPSASAGTVAVIPVSSNDGTVPALASSTSVVCVDAALDILADAIMGLSQAALRENVRSRMLLTVPDVPCATEDEYFAAWETYSASIIAANAAGNTVDATVAALPIPPVAALVRSLVGSRFPTPVAVMTAARRRAAVRTAADPVLRAHVADTIAPLLKLSTIPTASGVTTLSWDHRLFSVRRLQAMPLAQFAACPEVLSRVFAAQAQKLVKVYLHHTPSQRSPLSATDYAEAAAYLSDEERAALPDVNAFRPAWALECAPSADAELGDVYGALGGPVGSSTVNVSGVSLELAEKTAVGLGLLSASASSAIESTADVVDVTPLPEASVVTSEGAWLLRARGLLMQEALAVGVLPRISRQMMDELKAASERVVAAKVATEGLWPMVVTAPFKPDPVTAAAGASAAKTEVKAETDAVAKEDAGHLSDPDAPTADAPVSDAGSDDDDDDDGDAFGAFDDDDDDDDAAAAAARRRARRAARAAARMERRRASARSRGLALAGGRGWCIASITQGTDAEPLALVVLNSVGDIVEQVLLTAFKARTNDRALQMQTGPRAEAANQVKQAKQADIEAFLGVITSYRPSLILVDAWSPDSPRFVRDLETQLLFDQPWARVRLADPSVGRIFMRSPRARRELPNAHPLLRQAVGTGRFVLDPLSAVAGLWEPARAPGTDVGSSAGMSAEVLGLALHPLQDLVPPTTLMAALTRTLQRAVARLGVDVNLLVHAGVGVRTHRSPPVAFVPGLGPNKAKALLAKLSRAGAATQRADLLDKPPAAADAAAEAAAKAAGGAGAGAGLGPVVYRSAAGFMRVCARSAAGSLAPVTAARVPFLDRTRIPPEHYATAAQVLGEVVITLVDEKAVQFPAPVLTRVRGKGGKLLTAMGLTADEEAALLVPNSAASDLESLPADQLTPAQVAEVAEIRARMAATHQSVSERNHLRVNVVMSRLMHRPRWLIDALGEFDLDEFAMSLRENGRYELEIIQLVAAELRRPYGDPPASAIATSFSRLHAAAVHAATASLSAFDNAAHERAEAVARSVRVELLPVPALTPSAAPTAKTLFSLCTGETDTSLRVHQHVVVSVKSVVPQGVNVELPNRVRGFVPLACVSSRAPTHFPGFGEERSEAQKAWLASRIRPGMEVTAVILELQYERMSARLSTSSTDLRIPESAAIVTALRERPEGPYFFIDPSGSWVHPDDPHIAPPSTGGDADVGVVQRNIAHPLFQNITKADAEAVLTQMAPTAPSTVILRPSQADGRNAVCASFRVPNVVGERFFHVEILEKDKPAHDPTALGQKLVVDTDPPGTEMLLAAKAALPTDKQASIKTTMYTREYEDLDEVLARYVEPIYSHLQRLTQHRSFFDGEREAVRAHLDSEKRSRPRALPYLLSLHPRSAGIVEFTCRLANTFASERARVVPGGFRFKDHHDKEVVAANPDDLVAGMKRLIQVKNNKAEAARAAAAAAAAAAPKQPVQQPVAAASTGSVWDMLGGAGATASGAGAGGWGGMGTGATAAGAGAGGWGSYGAAPSAAAPSNAGQYGAAAGPAGGYGGGYGDYNAGGYGAAGGAAGYGAGGYGAGYGNQAAPAPGGYGAAPAAAAYGYNGYGAGAPAAGDYGYGAGYGAGAGAGAGQYGAPAAGGYGQWGQQPQQQPQQGQQQGQQQQHQQSQW